MIIRVKHRRNFTVVGNDVVRDGRLSFRATGVLVYLLSLPESTEISGLRIVDAKTEGRDAVYVAMKELEEAGYLVRERFQDSTGRWSTVCVVQEPIPENPESVPENPQPIPGLPIPGLPIPGNPESNYQVLDTNTDFHGRFLKNRNQAPLWQSGDDPALAPLTEEDRQAGLERVRALRSGGEGGDC